MTHHIVCQVGEKDQFVPVVASDDVTHIVAIDRPGDKHLIRNSIAEGCALAQFQPAAVVRDLVNFAMAVYSADVGIFRTTGYDSWTRDFYLHLPVHDTKLWSNAIQTITDMLSFLTGDHWMIDIRPITSPYSPYSFENSDNPPLIFNAVSLFSGGLDSFIGAIDRLESGDILALVGHHGAGTTNKFQEQAHAAIESEYKEKSLLFPFYVQPPKLSGTEYEKTTRSRSILFLCLGSTIAASIGNGTRLFVPENGLISLNPPLINCRMGTLSTRTTHPHFIQLFRNVLNALAIDVLVETPYRFRTKGEMAQGVLNTDVFLNGVHNTLSCSHPDAGRYSGFSPGQHCGYCVPCIIRRACLKTIGLDDPSKVIIDVLKNRPPITSDKGQDVRAFEMALERFATLDPRRLLFDVIDTGPIPPEEIAEFVAVYKRGMLEVQQLFVDGD